MPSKEVKQLQTRVEDLEETCKVQTDALVCGLVMLGELAKMASRAGGAPSHYHMDQPDLDLFREASDTLNENMKWLDEHNVTNSHFPERKSTDTVAVNKPVERLHLRIVRPEEEKNDT